MISAIAAAAMAAGSASVASAQNGPLLAKVPTMMTVSSPIMTTRLVVNSVATMAMTAADMGSTLCHTRSSVRSEWRPHRTIAMQAAM